MFLIINIFLTATERFQLQSRRRHTPMALVLKLDMKTFTKSCSIDSRKNLSLKCEVVHQTKFTLEISCPAPVWIVVREVLVWSFRARGFYNHWRQSFLQNIFYSFPVEVCAGNDARFILSIKTETKKEWRLVQCYISRAFYQFSRKTNLCINNTNQAVGQEVSFDFLIYSFRVIDCWK